MKRLSFIAAALLCFVTAVSAAIRPAQPGIGGGGSSSVNATNAARFAYGYRTGPVAISARTNVISYATQTVTSNFLYNGVGVFSNLTAGYYEISGGFNYYAVSNDTIKILIATNGVMADNLIAYSTYESTAGGGALGTNFVHISGMVYLPAVSAIASYIDYTESIAQTLNYQGAHLIIRPIDSASASATTGATGATGATGPAGGVSETNANQFGASTTLTLKDGVKLTNAVNEGITIFNGDSSNRANLIVKGAVNPKFRLTSVSPPQVLQLSSTGISTDAGGGQAYITISPEDYPTLRINTNYLQTFIAAYDLGSSLTPWGSLYAQSFIGSGTGAAMVALNSYQGDAFALTRATNSPAATGSTNDLQISRSSATAGQVLTLHSTASGQHVWTNATPSGGSLGLTNPVVVYRANANLDMIATTTETTNFTYTIPANTLSTNRALRFNVGGYITNFSGVNRTFRIRAYFGSTTIYDSSTAPITGTTTNAIWSIDGVLVNNDSAASQSLLAKVIVTGTGIPTTSWGNVNTDEQVTVGAFGGESAEDTTADRLFVITLTPSNADFMIRRRVSYGVLE